MVQSARFEEGWTDIIFGVHFALPLRERLSIVGLADLGEGDDSDSYQALVVAQWHFSEALTADIGYRVLDQDFEEDQFNWDVTYTGLLAGIGYRF